MNRNGSIIREFEAEGSDRSLQLAHALAQISDPEFLERIVHLKSSLDAWGGECYISAQRKPIDPATGRICDHNTPGREYGTLGYVIHYGHRQRAIIDQPEEPDEPLGIHPPERAPEPEPEEVGGTSVQVGPSATGAQAEEPEAAQVG